MHITTLRLTRREAQLVPEQNVFHTLHSPTFTRATMPNGPNIGWM